MKFTLALITFIVSTSAFAAEPFSCQGKDAQGEDVVIARDSTGLFSVSVNGTNVYGMAGFVWLPTLNPFESKYYNFEVDHSTIILTKNPLANRTSASLELNIFDFQTGRQTDTKRIEIPSVICS